MDCSKTSTSIYCLSRYEYVTSTTQDDLSKSWGASLPRPYALPILRSHPCARQSSGLINYLKPKSIRGNITQVVLHSRDDHHSDGRVSRPFLAE